MPFSTNAWYAVSFSDQCCKGQLAELPSILDSFYTSITSDYIGVDVGGGGEP